jgi:hypothetical protein
VLAFHRGGARRREPAGTRENSTGPPKLTEPKISPSNFLHGSYTAAMRIYPALTKLAPFAKLTGVDGDFAVEGNCYRNHASTLS